MADVRPINFTATASESDLNSDNFLWLDTPQKAKKLPGAAIAPRSVQDELVNNVMALTDNCDKVTDAVQELQDETANVQNFYDKGFAIVDANGNVGFAVLNNGDLEHPFFKDFAPVDDGGFAVADKNGNLLIYFKSNGDIVGPFFNNFRFGGENGFAIADKNGNVGFAIDNKGNIVSKDSANPQIVIPNKIVLAKGRNNPLYFESMLKNAFLGGLRMGRSNNTDAKYMTLSQSSAGKTQRTLNLYNSSGNIIASKFFTTVVPTEKPATYKICVIGDSKTENCSKLAQLINLCTSDENLSVSFIGSNTTSNYDASGTLRTIKTEGFSGRNIVDFCTSQTLGTHTNIWYNGNIEGDSKFDFAQGVTALGEVPDILWIDMGVNQRDVLKDSVIAYYESIIDSVKAYNIANSASVKVVISVQEIEGCVSLLTAEASGKRCLNSTATKVEDYIQAFENREDEGIYICPQYLFIDPFKDYPLTEVPTGLGLGDSSTRLVCIDTLHPGINLNNYSSTTTYNIGSVVNLGKKIGAVCLKNGTVGVEPTDDKVNWALSIGTNGNEGYFKIAEAYYATLKYIASIN